MTWIGTYSYYTILKFADNSKIFGKAITPADKLKLQLDLDALCKCAENWQIKFNVAKCKVMHTGPRNINCFYFMNGQLLNSVTEHKDLGVIISSNLKVADHCHYACNKANKMLGIIKRTIKHRNITVMVQLYKSLVRPHLEYCSPVWSPYYSKDKVMLESVQHCFTRLFSELRATSYEAGVFLFCRIPFCRILFRQMPCKLFFPSFSFLIPFINAIQHFYGCQQNARKNITVTVSVRVSVTVRVSLV